MIAKAHETRATLRPMHLIRRAWTRSTHHTAVYGAQPSALPEAPPPLAYGVAPAAAMLYICMRPVLWALR